MARMTKQQTFDYNEKKALFILVLLSGGESALRASALAQYQLSLRTHRRCENRQSTRERLNGRPTPRTSILCPPKNHSPWGRRVANTRNYNSNFALSVTRHDNNDSFPVSSSQALGSTTALNSESENSESELRIEFDNIDTTKSGAITNTDVRKRLPPVPVPIVDFLFSVFDTNNDGKIDFEEYKVIRGNLRVSPRLRLADLLNTAIVEILNAGAILLCSFLVAVSTLPSLPPIPIPTGGEFDVVRNFLTEGLSLTLTRDGSGVESLVLINATLGLFNYIFALDFFTRWYAFENFGLRYLTKPLSVLDIVAVLTPLAVQQFFPFLTVWNSPGIQNLLLLRILRLRRVLTDIDTFSRFEMALGLSPQDIRPFQLELARVVLSIFTLLSVSSGLIYTTEHGVNPQIPDYFSALYFGLTTLTTVGFGDITPITPGGRLVVCASILLGVAVIPAQAASLVDAILEFQNEEKPKQSSPAGAEIEASQNMNANTDAAEDNSSPNQRPTEEVGLVGTEQADLVDIIAIPNSQVTEERANNINSSNQAQVKQILRFSYCDLNKLPKVLSDIKEEIKASCPKIIADGSTTFAAVLTSYEADHIETEVNCHFDIQLGGTEYILNKEQVLLAIARVIDKNNVTFAIPAINYVNEEP